MFISNTEFRNLSINNTCDQLIGTLRWRESFNIKAALEEDFPPSIFENLAHISGSDKEGRLVVYVAVFSLLEHT